MADSVQKMAELGEILCVEIYFSGVHCMQTDETRYFLAHHSATSEDIQLVFLLK